MSNVKSEYQNQEQAVVWVFAHSEL